MSGAEDLTNILVVTIRKDEIGLVYDERL